jgi:hypothetical protein
MDGPGTIGPIWGFWRLDAVHRSEDLDDALETLLDALAEASAPADPLVRLSALLGCGVAEMERRTGLCLCDEVAAARLLLIEAAFAECLARTKGTGGGLRHALAVCAALQHETLGDVASSAAAFALLDDPRGVPCGVLTQLFLSSLPLGERAALAVVRARTLAVREAPEKRSACPISGSALAAE